MEKGWKRKISCPAGDTNTRTTNLLSHLTDLDSQ
jgi:hypothetical protein